jgi:hypothetical protein
MQGKRDILFYQANFEPEVCRMLDALEKKDEKYFNFFKIKTVKIIDEILNLSTRFVEKEEWGAIKEIVSSAEFATVQMKSILRNYGNCFSVKFANLQNN